MIAVAAALNTTSRPSKLLATPCRISPRI